MGIIGVTVSPLNSKKVWAIVENKEKGGIYFSDNAGISWKHINDSRALRQRAWYYSKIYADTQNEDVIYVSSKNLSRITKINKTDGSIIWHLGRRWLGENNIIEPNEQKNRFSGQHGFQLLNNNNSNRNEENV